MTTIPYDQLSPEALQGLLEQFVSRDGIDPGHAATSLRQKIRDVRRQLEKGSAVIVFDQTSQTCNIISRDDLKKSGK